MDNYLNETLKYCRWCGQSYYAHKPVDKDGFHLPKCKQAHYRAYKKYVTQRASRQHESTGSRRTSK